MAPGGGRHGGVGGTSLGSLLAEAGPDPDADEVVFTGLDRGMEGGSEQAYARALPLEEARRTEVLLVDEMNGGPLPPQHGAPVRLVVPGWYGMASVKWLSTIEVVRGPFTGYQNRQSYRLRQDPDEPGTPLDPDRAARAHGPSRHPRLLHARRCVVPLGRSC